VFVGRSFRRRNIAGKYLGSIVIEKAAPRTSTRCGAGDRWWCLRILRIVVGLSWKPGFNNSLWILSLPIRGLSRASRTTSASSSAPASVTMLEGPFATHQFPMPCEQRIGYDETEDLAQMVVPVSCLRLQWFVFSGICHLPFLANHCSLFMVHNTL
jgi:hypothetical protein